MRPATATAADRFDVGPLRDALDAAGGVGAALTAAEHAGRLTGTDRQRLTRALYRAFNAGHIGLGHADEVCVLVLERHPRNLWPHDW